MLVMLMGSLMIGENMLGASMMAATESEFSEYEDAVEAAVQFDLPSDRK
jgi:hypothetical protein